MVEASESANSTWLRTALELVAADNKTPTLLVSQQDVQDKALQSLAHVHGNPNWVADLALNKSAWIYTNDESQRRVLVVQHVNGDGDQQSRADAIRSLGQHTCKALNAMKVAQTVVLVSSSVEQADSALLGIFYNGLYWQNYQYDLRRDLPTKAADGDGAGAADARTIRTKMNLDSIELVTESGAEKQDGFRYWRVAAEATEMTRDWVNTRGSVAHPKWLEDSVRRIVDEAQCDLVKEVRVLQEEHLIEHGMNLHYNVGRGAEHKSRCIMVHYQGRPDSEEVDLALVGKGITYDTGGLNIKPTGGMETMWCDKGGACGVMGALKATMELRLQKNVVFCAAAAENAVGAMCYKPGDILTAMNGLTVEIGNTDAEGRLVLSDSMTYVQRNFKPKELIDMATLTGACMISLGLTTAGVFSMNDEMAGRLLESGKRSFNPSWRLPINDEFRNTMKGSHADLNNIGKSRFGGASQAAAFLERFVEPGVTWTHLDIAGPALDPQFSLAGCATGFGCPILLDYINNIQ